MKKTEKTVPRPNLVIVECGGQYTLQISTRLRERGFRTEVLSPEKAKVRIENDKPLGIILSGGHRSVNDENALIIPDSIIQSGIPMLALCYGMQSVAKLFDGRVQSLAEKKEYGPRSITIDKDNILFRGLGKNQKVLASHGDTVTKLPRGAVQIATSSTDNSVAGFVIPEKRIWAVQFHPESSDTPNGKQMLENFAAHICKCPVDWIPGSLETEIQNAIIQRVGPEERAILGYSGGVDSSVLGTIASQILENRLLGIVIDTGQFREGELEEIRANAHACRLEIVVVNAVDRMERALRGKVNGKRRRKAFSREYVKILEKEAKKFKAKFLLQGTLAPDVIESGKTGGDVIKKHHNVGLRTWLKKVEPIANLFKYEVRGLAREIGLPDSICNRMPSPGPGLLIRVLGKSPTKERVAVVRWADARVTEILKKYRLLKDISQYGTHIIFLPTAGVKGDGASKESCIAVVRTVQSIDFMTAGGFHIPEDVKKEIESVLTQLGIINRVMFDTTPKPPATIELL